MIVLDSSILIAIINQEDGAKRLLDVLSEDECAIGAPTLVEARLWCTLNLLEGSSFWFEDFIERQGVFVAPFSRDMADTASRAFAAFGRGSGHPAQLNFGDCLAYAVSAAMRAPLLFKGADFSRTDVIAHLASIRL